MIFSGNNAIPPTWTLKLPESWGESKTDFKGENDGITALFTNTRTLSSKSTFTIVFFAAVNHNYDHKQKTSKYRDTKRIEIHQTQITNHDLLNPLKWSSIF